MLICVFEVIMIFEERDDGLEIVMMKGRGIEMVEESVMMEGEGERKVWGERGE